MSRLTPEKAALFLSPQNDGVIKIENYFGEIELENMRSELNDPDKMQWRDVHTKTPTKRGVVVEQNYFSWALKLDRGDQSPYQNLGPIRLGTERIQRTVRGLSRVMPHLYRWTADELTIHRYDAPTGISAHRDHSRFIGMIAIGVLEGDGKFAIYRDTVTSMYPTNPGDLLLLRAPKPNETDERIRPVHALIDIKQFPRTSMVLRASSRPGEIFPDYTYSNWP